MSWSCVVVGKPPAIVAELDRLSATLTGESKAEFDDAKPNLVALLNQNYNTTSPDAQCALRLEANGHGHAKNDGTGHRNCSVKIEPFYGKIV